MSFEDPTAASVEKPSLADIRRKVNDSVSYIRDFLEYPDVHLHGQAMKYLLALFEYLMVTDNVILVYPTPIIQHLEDCYNKINASIDKDKEENTDKIIFNRHAEVYYRNKEHQEALKSLVYFMIATA